MKNKNILIIFMGFFLLGAFLVAAYFYKKHEKNVSAFMAKENSHVFVRDHSPSLGEKNAKVYLVEFLDPECEACRAFFLYVKKLVGDYKEDLRLVVRYATFHQNSVFAVKLIEAARKQGKYWETLELVFNYQPQWASHHDPQPDVLWSYLPQLGLDLEKLKKDMEDPEIMKIIEQDKQDGQTLKVKGTPSFFVNGRQLELLDFESLRKEIELEIKK